MWHFDQAFRSWDIYIYLCSIGTAVYKYSNTSYHFQLYRCNNIITKYCVLVRRLIDFGRHSSTLVVVDISTIAYTTRRVIMWIPVVHIIIQTQNKSNLDGMTNSIEYKCKQTTDNKFLKSCSVSGVIWSSL